MKHFLFSTHDLASFENCVENNRLWGRSNNKNAFKNLDITKGDRAIFYCAELKSFIAECEILESPRPISEHMDINLNVWKEVPVVIRLKKIRDLGISLDDNNWKFLTTFNRLK